MTEPEDPVARLCVPCRDERDRWLDTTPNRLIPRPGFAHGSGAAYDSSPAGVRDSRSARYQEWADTVNFQRELIATACRNGQHAAERKVDDDEALTP